MIPLLATKQEGSLSEATINIHLNKTTTYDISMVNVAKPINTQERQNQPKLQDKAKFTWLSHNADLAGCTWPTTGRIDSLLQHYHNV